MWMIFAETEPSVGNVWAVITTITTAALAAIVAALKLRAKVVASRVEEKRLQDEARKQELAALAEANRQIAESKRQEAETRKQELLDMKTSFTAIYKRWQEIASMFKDERDKLQEEYTKKCVECISLQVRITQIGDKGYEHDH